MNSLPKVHACMHTSDSECRDKMNSRILMGDLIHYMYYNYTILYYTIQRYVVPFLQSVAAVSELALRRLRGSEIEILRWNFLLQCSIETETGV